MERGLGGNLPAEATSFVGRRREIELARTLLSKTRLLTLTGPGGIGKTRLALRVADQVRRCFPDGVWFADLATTEDQEALAHTVLAAFDWENVLGRPPFAALTDRLRGQRALIVLDNCEHLLLPCASMTRKLLEAAPGLQIIATSRQALGLSAERVLTVPSLAAPEPGHTGPGSRPNEALQLFAERAAAVLGEFAPSPAESTAALMICHRLDGIPLALEMAAARLRVLSCEQILQRLDDRFGLLKGGCRGGLPRQQTLRAALDWSFDLCTDKEQMLWARLSVFTGSFDLDAVEAVCAFGGLGRDEILDLVAGLTEKSVLGRYENPHRARYRMLDTLRHYGRLRMRATQEEHALRRRHRDHYRAMALRANDEWFTPNQSAWASRLFSERPNLRTAMKFCLEEQGEASAGLEMAAALWSHRLGTGHLTEERRWLSRTLASATEFTTARAKAVWADAWLALLCGDSSATSIRVDECHALAAFLNDPLVSAHADQLAGLAALFQDDFAHARNRLESALDQYRACGNLGDVWITLFLLSLVCCLLKAPRAATMARECLALCEDHDAQWCRPYALWTLGLHHWLHGETHETVRLLREGLRASSPAHNRLAMAQCLEVLAWARAHDGHHAEAAELLGAVQNIWETVGAVLPGVGHLLHHRTATEALLTKNLGATRFSAILRAGAELSLEESLAKALGSTPERGGGPTREAGADLLLTPREQQVAALLAQGLTDKQIAAQLVVSLRTAQGHVQRILRKLGFTSRAQVAAWAWNSGTKS
ncbi:ATP-binding protein [Streptomyces sp. NPDC058992]|uniref:ATP-binding protein n=1 Tax=Streptomyces sp. NPDC058992 TaxID=3346688 RepID=UPI0036912201